MNSSIKKSGFVSIIGRPNVGKSTFLNFILGKKVSITSDIPQTTRYIVKGIYSDSRGQIVFMDTPGFYEPQHRLGEYFLKAFKISQEDADCILYMTDATRSVGREEIRIMEHLIESKIPVIMALNKIDKSQEFLHEYIEYWKNLSQNKKDPLKYYIPISAVRGDNVNKVLGVLFEGLPQGDFFYPQETITDFPQRLFVADLIREKFYFFLKEELPHCLGVHIEDVEDRSGLIYIKALIYVEKPSQKKIVIGKGGEVLKEAGRLARQELESIFSKKVFLDLWVKVKEDWRNRPDFLREMGFYF